MDDIPDIIWLEEIDSTNRYAMDNFAALSDGTMVAAGTQTAGRGRLARRWVSPPRQNAYVSYVIKEFPGPAHQASWIGSLAVLDALRECAPSIRCWLKWPNDVYCGHRKISGILCEGHCSGGCVDGIIIGIGVNINMPPRLLAEIDQPATSVLAETGQVLNLEKFLLLLAKGLRRRYISGSACIDGLYREWKAANAILGREIEVVTDRENAKISGHVIDFGVDGELILKSNGELLKFFSGDVKIQKDSLFG